MVKGSAQKKAILLGLALLLALLLFLERVFQERNIQTMNYKPISGPIENPLMGLAPWATITESTQPHTLVYADLTWREFEPEQGRYDFDSFERNNQLGRWRSEHKRLVFRFICDKPGEVDHLDIPNWLFQAIKGDGDRYSNEYGKGFSPNYSNPTFIELHQAAIRALGKRYGEDNFFFAVELGSLGHWGEWHVHGTSGIRRLPPERVRDAFVHHYVEAFPNTFLLMRRPFNIARQLNLGLYNDMMGDLDSTTIWLNWIANGGDYDQTREMDALSAMPAAWRTAPVGGEQTFSMSQEELYGANLNQTIQLIEKSHATFIGPNGPYQIDLGGPYQNGIDQVLERIGYRIYIRQARMPRWILFKMNLSGSVVFTNDGIAPMYYNWPAKWYILSEDGKINKTFQAVLDVRKIMPGESYSVAFDLPVHDLKRGKYILGFAILDPLTNQPAVRLAMANPRQDLIQPLGRFDVLR